ncbi:hypothetical protein MPER_10670 [Moniliophthora perniciosa FA553]|nr:hypothetical protein MPER_10670 [Moniliophthora perniciosa FA553]
MTNDDTPRAGLGISRNKTLEDPDDDVLRGGLGSGHLTLTQTVSGSTGSNVAFASMFASYTPSSTSREDAPINCPEERVADDNSEKQTKEKKRKTRDGDKEKKKDKKRRKKAELEKADIIPQEEDETALTRKKEKRKEERLLANTKKQEADSEGSRISEASCRKRKK